MKDRLLRTLASIKFLLILFSSIGLMPWAIKFKMPESDDGDLELPIDMMQLQDETVNQVG